MEIMSCKRILNTGKSLWLQMSLEPAADSGSDNNAFQTANIVRLSKNINKKIQVIEFSTWAQHKLAGCVRHWALVARKSMNRT